MSGKYFVSPQEAVLALDDAYQSGSVEKVLDVVAGQNAHNFRYEMEKMGFEIYQRTNNVFTQLHSELGLDHDTLEISRRATMPNDMKCIEKYLVESTDQGWQVVKRQSINAYNRLMIKFDGHCWKYLRSVPSLNVDAIINVEADDRGPSQEQLELIEIICSDKRSLKSEIAEANFKFVKDVLSNWLGNYDKLTQEELTDVLGLTFTKPETPEQSLSSMVRPFEIFITEVKPEELIAFVFSAGSMADNEHGVAFKIVDWKVVEFGQQGDIL